MISMSSLPHHLSGSRLARRYSRRVLMLSVRSLACRTGTQELRVSKEMRRISSRAYCGRTRARVSRLEAPPGPVPARRRRRRRPRCQRRDRRHRGCRRRRWWPWCHQTAGGGGGCIARRRAWRASQLAAGRYWPMHGPTPRRRLRLAAAAAAAAASVEEAATVAAVQSRLIQMQQPCHALRGRSSNRGRFIGRGC